MYPCGGQSLSNGVIEKARMAYSKCFCGIAKQIKNTADKDCELCGNKIKKEAYMGGSIYYCEGCQKN